MDFRTLIAGVVGLLASVAALAAPEPPPFRQLGVAEGLPSSRLTGLAQDRDGYLWIGTRDGLARFDGVGYAIHRQAPGVAGSLPGNFVQTVFVDSGNRVWVGIEGQGFCVLGPERRAFRQYSQATRPLMRSDDVWAIAETPDGYLWFGTFGGGLYRLDPKDRLTRFLPAKDRADSLPDENVLALAVDARGVLWVGTSSGLARWTGSGFERMPEGSTSGDIILSLSADAAGELWIGTDQGLDLRHADGRFEVPPWRGQLPDPGVNSVLRDRAGAHWIATSRGLVRESAGVVDTMAGSAAAGAPMNISLEDNEGGLWFASENSGLLRLPADWRRFRAFRAEGDRFAAKPFRGAAPARDGGAWLAAGKGRLDHFDPRALRLSNALDLEAELPGARLWSVLERADGMLWLGHTKGLSRFDPRTHAWRHWRQDDERARMLTGPVRLLAEDETGLLWLASYGGGVQARDREGAIVHSFEPGQGGIDSPEQDQLGRGPDGALWLAGPKGLRRWNSARQRFEPVVGAPAERVYGFALQDGGLVWLHRIGALESYRWDGAGLRRELSVRAGASLPAVESGGVMVDRAGRAWVASARGLLRYDPASGRLRNFGIPDGLPAQEFQSLAPMLLPTGEALVGSGDALVLFDPATIPLRAFAAPLVLDSVRLRGEDGEQALRADGGALTLQPEDRDLRVSARLLSFADPAAHRYRFRLHGYEAGWIESGNAGERVFSRLEPGDYRLEVAARNAEGVWSPARGFPLRVLAPWWQRPWAIAAWTALGALALLLAARAYRRRVRDRHAEVLREQRRQLADQGSAAKTRFLANLGHEIRTPMTGVLGMAELLQAGSLDPRQERQVQAIRRAGEHLLRLVNDALDLARIEAGKLVLEEAAFDLHELLDEAAALLQPLARAKGLDFAMERVRGTPRVLLGDAGRLRQILLNLAGNAIKFTERGSVGLRCAPEALGVCIEVRDSGEGMDAAQVARLFRRFEQAEGLSGAQRREGSGLGLAICQELAAAMDGSIEVDSTPGRGTVFRVHLPLPAGNESALPARPAVRQPPRPAAGRRVLVVEDDPTVAEVVVGLLESLGYEAVHAPQALAALAELAQGEFALALLDLDLPGMDGFELARILRLQAPRTRLLALTARADAQAEPEALASGMHGFLRKPLTSALLQEAIENVFAGSRATPELGAALAG